MYTDRCNECHRQDTVLYECYYCNRVFCFEHAQPRTHDNPVGHFCPEFEARLAAKKAELEAKKAQLKRESEWKSSQLKRDEWKQPKKEDWNPPSENKKLEPNHPDYSKQPYQEPSYDKFSKRDYYKQKTGGILNFLIVLLIAVIILITLYRIFIME